MKKCILFLAFSVSLFFTSCLSISGSLDFISNAGYIENAIVKAGTSVSKATEKITPENEYYIGRAVAANILANYEFYNDNELELYLNKICQVLVAPSVKPELYAGYFVKVLDSREVNAFATSGGHIFVTRGLLHCIENEDSLAAVIAHEIAHIQLQHSLQMIKQNRWTNAINDSINLIEVISDEDNDDEFSDAFDEIIEESVITLISSGYSKNQEFEADTYALELMNDAGYDPKKMLEMLNQLKKFKKENNGLYKTHPSLKSRLSNVEKTLSKMNLSNIEGIELRTERFNNFVDNIGRFY